MKTALLHYWLTNMRGGEKVLRALGNMLPEADMFTHAYLPERFGETSRASLWGHRVNESFIAKLPLGRHHPQAYLPFMPLASRSLRLDRYDLVISSESGPIKGIRKARDMRHICYCHTPMRYLWDMHDEYYRSAGFGGKMAMLMFTGYLRREDLKSVESVDAFVANSEFVAERIGRIYGRKATVVYPPVDVDFFSQAAVDSSAPPPFADRPYYLYAGELRDYKRPDLAIDACLRMSRRLLVIGNGRLQETLRRRIGGRGDVMFLGRVSDDDLRKAFAHAKALIFPGVEDFGIVPVEAQAAGTPVIAFGKGGALETVKANETGLFFKEQTVDSLCGAIEAFEGRSWNPDACIANAKRFVTERFVAGMKDVMKGMGLWI